MARVTQWLAFGLFLFQLCGHFERVAFGLAAGYYQDMSGDVLSSPVGNIYDLKPVSIGQALYDHELVVVTPGSLVRLNLRDGSQFILLDGARFQITQFTEKSASHARKFEVQANLYNGTALARLSANLAGFGLSFGGLTIQDSSDTCLSASYQANSGKTLVKAADQDLILVEGTQIFTVAAGKIFKREEQSLSYVDEHKFAPPQYLEVRSDSGDFRTFTLQLRDASSQTDLFKSSPVFLEAEPSFALPLLSSLSNHGQLFLDQKNFHPPAHPSLLCFELAEEKDIFTTRAGWVRSH